MYSRGQVVDLERGVSVTITDIPEDVQERLLVGKDDTGKYHVFPDWEIVNVEQGLDSRGISEEVS